MGEHTHISWCDHTFNFWVGCMKVSVGEKGACEHCYAQFTVETRHGWAIFGGPGVGVGTRKLLSEGTRRKPIAWNKAAAAAGRRPFVFCSSLADVFDNAVDPEWRKQLFDLVRATPHLVWLFLTKRPQNIEKMAEAAGGLPPNVALGCTAVTQEEANRDVIHLVRAATQLDALFAFVSCEPLMGEIDFFNLDLGFGRYLDAFAGVEGGPAGAQNFWTPIGWVISGGETDQGKAKARATNPAWERRLRDDCASIGVPYHRKQAGEWVEAGHPSITDATERLPVTHVDGRLMAKVGKARAGRELDGVIYDARPVVEGLAA